MIQSDQKQHSFGVAEVEDDTALGVGVLVAVVPVVGMVEGAGAVGVLVAVVPVVGMVEGAGAVVGVGREDVQTLKYFSTVPLGPQISQ